MSKKAINKVQKSKNDKTAVKTVEIFNDGHINFRLINNDGKKCSYSSVNFARGLLGMNAASKASLALSEIRIDESIKADAFNLERIVRLLLFYVSEAARKE